MANKRKRSDEELHTEEIREALLLFGDANLSMKQLRRKIEKHLGFGKGTLHKDTQIEGQSVHDIISSHFEDQQREPEDPEEIPMGAPLLKRTLFTLLLERGDDDITLLSTKEIRQLLEQKLSLAHGASKAIEGFSIKKTVCEFKVIRALQEETDAAVERANQAFFTDRHEPYSYSLLKHAFILMNDMQSTQELTPKMLREALEKELEMAPGSLKNKKAEILQIAEDYKLVLKMRATRLKHGKGSIIKYSKTETRIIMGMTRDYMRVNNLRVEDVVSYLGDQDSDEGIGRKRKKTFKTKSLVTDLVKVFPYRSRVALISQLTYKLTAFLMTRQWTAEQERQLMYLHGIYGSDWSSIARILGKRRNDCYHAYMRAAYPRRQGTMSDAERKDLIHAVRQVLGKMDEPLSKLPFLGISWMRVGELMGHRRSPIAYCHKWRSILGRKRKKKKLLLGGDFNLDVKLLETIKKEDAEDESEINWSGFSIRNDLSRSFNGELNRWRSLVKRRCPPHIVEAGFCTCLDYLLKVIKKEAKEKAQEELDET